MECEPCLAIQHNLTILSLPYLTKWRLHYDTTTMEGVCVFYLTMLSVTKIIASVTDKMWVEHWWTDCWAIMKYPEKNLSQYHFMHHKCRLDSAGINPGPPKLVTGDSSPKPCHVLKLSPSRALKVLTEERTVNTSLYLNHININTGIWFIIPCSLCIF